MGIEFTVSAVHSPDVVRVVVANTPDVGTDDDGHGFVFDCDPKSARRLGAQLIEKAAALDPNLDPLQSAEKRRTEKCKHPPVSELEALFCHHCGVTIIDAKPVSELEALFCDYCGVMIIDAKGVRTCYRCGHVRHASDNAVWR